MEKTKEQLELDQLVNELLANTPRDKIDIYIEKIKELKVRPFDSSKSFTSQKIK
ncbi:hypothetical protein [Psychrobacillus sp. FSL K6-2843]|uniref:hypothetical protein n=1 Tax=Psychrobacillus sp. FSL K6-2843 TaxID=2921549 RepID=UPI00315A7467